MANVFDRISGDAHVVAESTKLRSTHKGGGHMANIRMAADADNGCLFSLGSYVEDEVYAGVAPAEGSAVYLIITPPLAYNSDRRFYADEKYFYNAAGEIARGYQIFEDDFFCISANGFSDTKVPAKDDYVTYTHATQLYTASEEAPESGFVGQVTNVIVRANGDVRYEIRVINPFKPVAAADENL